MAFDRKYKIFLVDDHPLVREYLGCLIHQQDDLIVCGEAETNQLALERIAETEPDLAIVDISLKGGSGLQLVKMVKNLFPAVATIVLSMHDEKLYAERAIRAGARGYVTKRESSRRIITAIREVLAGKLAVSDEVAVLFAEKYAEGSRRGTGDTIEILSDRELEVFRLLGQGVDTRAIGVALNISMKTVQVYCARIKEKLHLANGNELLREAIQWTESDRH